MRSQPYCIRVQSAISAFFMFSAVTASAANGVWNGTQNAFWTNSLNWSASPYPFAADTALFANDGNGQTALDLTGLPSIKYITYDSPSVAAFTNGTGAANSQTLVLENSGEIKLSSTAGNSQVFNCGVQLGTDRSQQSYTFRNDSLSQSLIFNDVFGCPLEISGGTGYAGAKTLVVNGKGSVALSNLKAGGATTLTLTDLNSGTLTLAGSNTLYALNMNGGANSVITIADNELYLSNLGGTVLVSTLGGTINGPGKLRLSTIDGYSSAGYDYANLNLSPGMRLVINAGIIGQGGIEPNTGTGTLVLNGTNTFEGHVCLAVGGGAISVSSLGNRGSLTSNCGQGTNLYFSGDGGRLIYTGTGEDSDRAIVMNNNGKIDQSGPSGKLRFTATPRLLSSRTLTLQGNTAGVGEFSAPLTNTAASVLSITKAGSGTWIFSATNTYTGATAINGGKLLVNSPGRSSGSTVTVSSGGLLGGDGTVAGNVTVAAGGMLAPGDVNSVGTLNLGGTLSLTSSTLFFDVSMADTMNVVTDKVAVVGALTVAGTNTIVLSFPNGTAPAGTYTLMTFPSRTGASVFKLASAYPNISLVTNATSVKIDVVGGTYATTWTGVESEDWNGLNWTNGSAAASFAAGDAVAFDDSAERFTVSSATPVVPGALLFNNSANNYAVSAAIEGTGVVYKLGSGAVALSGANSYTGQTTILEGTLTINGAGLLGGGNYAASLVNNGLLNYASSVAQTNSGVISGGGDLVSSGNGTLTLSGNNTYYGQTTVTGGVLKVMHANALGGTTFGTVVAAGAALEVAGGLSFAAELLDLRGTLSSQAGTNTYTAAIWPQDGSTFDVGPGSLLIQTANTMNTGTNAFISKTGAGTLRFTGDPNHIGTFTIAGGVVELQHTGSTDCPIFINPGATLQLNNANNNNQQLGDYAVTVNGTLNMRTSDQIGALNGSGLVTNGSSTAWTLTAGGNNQSGEFSGMLQNGAATLSFAKTQNGVQTLSGTNTYSGGTTLSGGQLNINFGGSSSANSAIGTGTFTIGGAYAIDNTSGSDVTLSPVIPQNWNGDFTFLGSKSLNLGAGAVTLGANRTVTILTNTLTVGGAVGGAFSLSKNGGGTLMLNGANTYSGATTVNGGTLLINGSTVASSAVTVYSGILGGSGTISGTVTVASGSIVAPGGAGSIGTLTLPNTTTNVLTLNGSTLLFDLPGVPGASDKIAITNANGKLVLNGANTVALNIPAGGVLAGDYILMTCAGGITTNAGATLALQRTYPNASLAVIGRDVVLTVTGAGISASVTWTGLVSPSWDGIDQNWTNGSAAVAFTPGDAVTFDDTALNNFSVTSGDAVSPASVFFNNSVNPYEVSATLSGAAPFSKQGFAGVTLLDVSAYNPASLSVSDGTLTLGGSTQLNGGAYAGAFFNNGALSYASSAAQTLSGMISGGGVLTKYGNGTLTLSGSNTYNGATFVNAGVLKLQHGFALGSTAAGTTVAPGATLELAGTISTLADVLTLNGKLASYTGSNTYNGDITLNTGAAIDVGTGSTLVLKKFWANGPFTKTGSGWLMFTTDPNGNGQMTVDAGVAEIFTGTMDANVVVNDGASLVETVDGLNAGSRVTVNAGGTYVLRASDTIDALSGAGTVTQDKPVSVTLTLANNAQSNSFSGVIKNDAGMLGLAKTGSGTLTLSGANTYTGATAVTSGTLIVNSPGSLAAGSSVTVGSTGALGGSGTVNGPVTFAFGGSLIPGGLNTLGTLTLGSTLTLNGNTLYCDLPASGGDSDKVAVTGALTLNGVNPVVLSFPAGAALAGNYTLMTFASKVGDGSFALFGSYPNASVSIVGNSLVLSVEEGGTYGLTWNGNVSPVWEDALNWEVGGTPASYAAGDAVLFDDSATSFTVGGGTVTPGSVVFNNSASPYFVSAALSGPAPLVKFGTAAVTLNGATAYNPASITLGAGQLWLANAARLNGGTYAGNIANNGAFYYYSSAAQTLSGAISGAGSLIKNNSGYLILSGANTYSGGTTLSSGTLELQNDAGLSFNNNFTVSGSSTLRAGRVTSGPGVTHALGTLSIGNYTLSVNTGANVSANSPYGVTFGTTTLSANTATFDVPNNGTGRGTLTLGALGGNYNLTKNGAGMLFLGTAGSRAGGIATLSAGTLKLGNAAGVGTTASSFQLNGGILDLAIDTSVNAISSTVGGNTVIQSDRATANSDGITHTLGTLSIGAYTLTVTNGTNVKVSSPFGLTFGATTLTAAPFFDVGNNGAGVGTLTLGAVGGNFALTKRGPGTLKLTGVNTYNGVTTVSNGRVLGVSGGSSSSSAVTLQSSGIAGAAAKLGVLCAAANGTWTCASLLTTNAVSPATSVPGLEFYFGVQPSSATAPLQVTGNATFVTNPVVSVYLGNLGSVAAGIYPLMTVAGTAYTNVTLPTLIVFGGYSGSTLSWSGKTLNLNLTGSPAAITWGTEAAGSGIWDVNNSTNTVWKDVSAAATSYQESLAGGTGDRVIFDDTYISTNTVVTLNHRVAPASVAFSNVNFTYTLTGNGGITGALSVVKAGSNLVTLATANSYTGGTVVADGTLTLASGGTISHSQADIVVGSTVLTNALLTIESGASVTNRWLVLGTTNGAAGALYNQGSLVVAGGTSVTNFVLGLNPGGYGYYRHDTARPLTMGETGIGGAYNGNGVFDVLQGAVTNSTFFQLNRGSAQQYAQLNVQGGRFVMPNSNANAHYFYASNSYGAGVINVSGGGLLGSAGTGTELDLIKLSTNTTTLGVLNILSSGTVQATKVKSSRGYGTALVNFNGGTLKVNNGGFLMLGGSNIDRATVFAGGATIDTDGKNTAVSQALLAPTGNGVTFIEVTAPGSGYIGRPLVSITGGGGTGATGVADFDPANGVVSGVTITSPGYDYTSAPSVTFIGGGGVAPTVGTVTIGPVASGGLTKSGNGTLTLSGASTFTGTTIVSNGVLKLGAANALSANSPVIVAGGTLDLNGYTLTNASVNLSSGSIVNGKLFAPVLQGADSGVIQAQIVSTNGLEKEGSGTLIVGAPLSYPGDTVISGGTVRLSGRSPGLYEGRSTLGNFDLTTVNPKTATPLSARYAMLWFTLNAESGGIWADQSTYIYTGYLWNSSPTNETWSFIKYFDDNARLMINGVNVLQSSSSAATVVSNAAVNAGANAFELRLGQGTGGVGPNNGTAPLVGVGFDRLGRGLTTLASYSTLTDPGDGSLLTLTNVFDLANANLLPTNSSVTVAANALLDLGGTGLRVAGLSGSGVVSNGALTVSGAIAPGGVGTIGTLTLATSSATLSGTLRVDASDDGSCDVLAVQGDVTLSGLALNVEDPGQMTNRRLQYTILTCAGTRTGTFASKNLPSGWMASYEPNGDIKLIYMGGTMIRLR